MKSEVVLAFSEFDTEVVVGKCVLTEETDRRNYPLHPPHP